MKTNHLLQPAEGSVSVTLILSPVEQLHFIWEHQGFTASWSHLSLSHSFCTSAAYASNPLSTLKYMTTSTGFWQSQEAFVIFSLRNWWNQLREYEDSTERLKIIQKSEGTFFFRRQNVSEYMFQKLEKNKCMVNQFTVLLFCWHTMW